MKVFAENRKARFDYEILETFEAGLVLTGTEVKSIREGRVSLKDAYVDVRNGELYLVNMYVAPYPMAAEMFQHDPERPRKLLLHRYEINRIIGKLSQRGLTAVPLRLYARGPWIKAEIALVRGKRKYEKRESIKRRELEREIERARKRYP